MMSEYSKVVLFARQEWNALRARLKTLGGSTTAVSLLNLRQDAGFLATTAGSLPFVATHPDVFLDLPLTGLSSGIKESTQKIQQQEKQLRTRIDVLIVFVKRN